MHVYACVYTIIGGFIFVNFSFFFILFFFLILILIFFISFAFALVSSRLNLLALWRVWV